MYYASKPRPSPSSGLAANTAYQGFPRLAALLARDRSSHDSSKSRRPPRLSNGIVVLAGVAAGLIWIYAADVEALIHLYVIGVFTAFTLSQTGMVRYWLARRPRLAPASADQRRRALLATFVVTLVVIWTKFAAGAWMVIIAIPLLVLAFLGIHRHYRKIARRLRAGTAAVRAAGMPRNQVLVVPDTVDVATESALWYAQRIAPACPRAPLPGPRHGYRDPAPLVQARGPGPAPRAARPGRGTHRRRPRRAVEASPWRAGRRHRRHPGAVPPPFAPSRGRRTRFASSSAFCPEPGVVVADVPAISGKQSPEGQRRRTDHADPGRRRQRRFHASPELRAIPRRRRLGAVFFATGPSRRPISRRPGCAARIQVPLEVLEAPYRDIGDPLLRYSAS